MAVIVLGLITIALVLGVGTFVNLTPGFVELVAATTGSVLFALMMGQVAMLAGATRGGRGFALGAGWGVALIGYLLNTVSGLDESLDWLKWASPLSYATMTTPVSNGFPPSTSSCWGAIAVLFGATMVVFDRHDLT